MTLNDKDLYDIVNYYEVNSYIVTHINSYLTERATEFKAHLELYISKDGACLCKIANVNNRAVLAIRKKLAKILDKRLRYAVPNKRYVLLKKEEFYFLLNKIHILTNNIKSSALVKTMTTDITTLISKPNTQTEPKEYAQLSQLIASDIVRNCSSWLYEIRISKKKKDTTYNLFAFLSNCKYDEILTNIRQYIKTRYNLTNVHIYKSKDNNQSIIYFDNISEHHLDTIRALLRVSK